MSTNTLDYSTYIRLYVMNPGYEKTCVCPSCGNRNAKEMKYDRLDFGCINEYECVYCDECGYNRNSGAEYYDSQDDEFISSDDCFKKFFERHLRFSHQNEITCPECNCSKTTKTIYNRLEDDHRVNFYVKIDCKRCGYFRDITLSESDAEAEAEANAEENV